MRSASTPPTPQHGREDQPRGADRLGAAGAAAADLALLRTAVAAFVEQAVAVVVDIVGAVFFATGTDIGIVVVAVALCRGEVSGITSRPRTISLTMS